MWLLGLATWLTGAAEAQALPLRVFARSSLQLQAEEEEIQGLIKQRSAYQQELREKSVQGLNVAEYLTYQHYFETSLKDLLFRQEK